MQKLGLASPFGRGGTSLDVTEREIGNAERCVILNSPVKKNNQLLDRAKELRREMTPQERKLWYCFLRRYPVKIYNLGKMSHH